MREIIERFFQLFYEYRPGKMIPDNGKQLCDAIESMLHRNQTTKFWKNSEVESMLVRGVLGEFGKSYHYDPETVNKWILEFDKGRTKNNIEEMRARHGFEADYKPTDQDRAVGSCATYVMQRACLFDPTGIPQQINERTETEKLANFETWQIHKIHEFFKKMNQEENPYFKFIEKTIKRMEAATQ